MNGVNDHCSNRKNKHSRKKFKISICGFYCDGKLSLCLPQVERSLLALNWSTSLIDWIHSLVSEGNIKLGNVLDQPSIFPFCFWLAMCSFNVLVCPSTSSSLGQHFEFSANNSWLNIIWMFFILASWPKQRQHFQFY